MPVDTAHPDYTASLETWQLCRDAADGQRAIHAGGVRYLPKLGGQDEAEYKAYKDRALYTNLMGHTIEVFTGMIFRKPPVVTADGLDDFLADVTDTGIDLQGFAEQTVEDVFKTGRAGLLIDHQEAPEGDEPLTAARAIALGLRPFWRAYAAEDIGNWRTGKVLGYGEDKTLVVLREYAEEVQPDGFEVKSVLQYRVLQLVDGVYTQTVHKQSADGKGWDVSEPITPLKNGKPMGYIPFIFFGSKNTDARVDKAPLEDLAHVNIQHYKVSADYYYAGHYCSLPTLSLSGFTRDEVGDVKVGPSSIIWSSNVDAKSQYLMVDSKGFDSLRAELARLEATAATLGTRALAPEKKAAEAADTVSIRAAGEGGVVASVAMAVSHGLSQALRITADWMGLPSDDISVKLNTDFFPRSVSPQMVSELMKAVLSGKLAAQSFYEYLSQNEVISGARNYEEEQAVIEEESGAGVGMEFGGGGVE